MPQTVLILGAGVTGSLCASLLHKNLPNSTIKILDKARGVGGRMTTSRNPDVGQGQADLGAQFITTDAAELGNGIYNHLIAEGLLIPLDGQVEGMKQFPFDARHFVAPKGTNSIVKSFLANLPADSTLLNRTVLSLKLKAGKISTILQNDIPLEADVVISTIPVPQLLKLQGIQELLQPTVQENLNKVTYSTRFVLIWYYKSSDGFVNPDWISKYIDTDDIIRFVSVDHLKRCSNDSPSIVFHTTVQYGTKNISKTKEEVADELNKRAQRLFPTWAEPSATKCHKWLYSQVQNPYPGMPGCVVVHSRPTLILAGDAFSSSNFNGCIASANEAVNKLIALC